MKKYLKIAGSIVAGILLMSTSYAVGADIIHIELPESLAAVASVFDGGSRYLYVTRDVNSPSGPLIAGRSQTFATFDVKANNIGDVTKISNIALKIKSNDIDNILSISAMQIRYDYCLSKGDVYAYGYFNAATGLYCNSYTNNITNVTKNGDEYDASVAVNLPIYSRAVSATFTVIGMPWYKSNPTANANLRVYLNGGIVAVSKPCSTVSYGYKGKTYSYVTCTPVQPTVKFYQAYGNLLQVSHPYGYGYSGGINMSNINLGATCQSTQFLRDLTVGSIGDDVAALQNLLVAKGLVTIPAGVSVGYFGNLTKAAVTAYELSKGITPADGYFGPIARAAVSADCSTVATIVGGTSSSTTSTKLSTPTGLTTRTGSACGNINDITVSWNPVVGASGYHLFRSTSVNGVYTEVTNGDTGTTGTSWTDKTPSPSTTYYYKVRSFNKLGTSDATVAVSGVSPTSAAECAKK